MATKKPRVLVTLEPALYEKVKALSKANGTTLSSAARDLIHEAAEDVEEWGLASLARERLASLESKKLIPHSKAW